MGSRRVGGGVGGRRWGSVPACPLPCLPSPDCDLHCKPTRGSYRISLKKFCRKDYGRQPSGLLPPPSHLALPTFPLDTLTLAGPIPQVPHGHWPCPLSPLVISLLPPLRCPLCALPLQWLSCFPLCPPSWPLAPGSPPSSLPLPSLTPPPSRPLRSGAGGGGCARRGAWLVDALPGGRARRVPERRGARTAREQRTVGALTGCCLRLPTPATWSPLPAAGWRARGRGPRGPRGPRARPHRRSREPRAALARRVDAATSETAAPRAAGALRGGLSPRARLGLGGALLPHQGARSTSASVCGGVFAHIARVAI